ncbi:MAG: PEP-CTERM sorting domain-containing protein [Planctomycetota bacterium]
MRNSPVTHPVRFRTAALIAASAGLAFATSAASGQVIATLSDSAADWTTDSPSGAQADFLFDFDYSTYDLFGDGYLTGSIPASPNGGGSTTGILLSANNNSLEPDVGNPSYAALFANGVDVGAGTANEDYVLKFDLFHSTANGVYYAPGEDGVFGTPENPGDDLFELNGSTNYAAAGINYGSTTLRIQTVTGSGSFNAGGTDQGIFLGATADSGAAEDYFALFGGDEHRARSNGADGNPFQTGLTPQAINDAFIANPPAGFDTTLLDTGFPGDDNAFSPVVGSEANFDPAAAADSEDPLTFADRTAFRQYWVENFPLTPGTPHYTISDLGLLQSSNLTTDPEDPVFFPPEAYVANNDTGAGEAGLPYNRWTEHEVYYVDGTFQYLIDGVLVSQITPDDDDTSDDQNVFGDLSDSGTVLLAFYDRFSSVSNDPEGANFAIFDNVVIEEADASDLLDVETVLANAGFIPGGVTSGLVGDYDEDGQVAQGDLNLVLNNWGQARTFEDPGGTVFSSANVDQEELNGVLNNWGAQAAPSFEGFTVPEPATAAALGLLALAGLRRRSA